MAWPYPQFFDAGSGKSIPDHNAGDLIFYICNHNTSIDGGIDTPVDDGAGGAYTDLIKDLHYTPAYRENHDIWVKVADGTETVITTDGSIDMDAVLVVHFAQDVLSFYNGFFDQDVVIHSNPNTSTEPTVTPVTTFNSSPNTELIFFTMLNFGQEATSTYVGPQGKLFHDEGDSLDNGILLWANRIGGSSSPGAEYDLTSPDRYFEGCTILYLYLPYDGPRINMI